MPAEPITFMMVAQGGSSQSVVAAVCPESRSNIGFDLPRPAKCRYASAAIAPKTNPGPDFMRTIILLTISNIFMTFAWYGHLKYKDQALWLVILASWGIAFFEYCFQVPANRWGHGQFSTT